MHQTICPYNLSTVSLADALVTKANSQQWFFASPLIDSR
jgi:hypothetical protein